MNGIFFWILASFFWSVSDVVTRVFSDKVNPLFWTVLIAIGIFISTSIALMFAIKFWISEKSLVENKMYIYWLLFSGLLNGVWFIFFFKFFQNSGNFTQWLPIILVASILFSVLYWVIFFKDAMTPKIILWVIFAGISIYLLSSK